MLREIKIAQKTNPTKISFSRPASNYLRLYIKVGGHYVCHNLIETPKLCRHYEFRQRLHAGFCKLFGFTPLKPSLSRWL